jgi:hypothetical protein
MHAHAQAHTHTRAHTCTHTNEHTHAHAQARARTHTHTHTPLAEFCCTVINLYVLFRPDDVLVKVETCSKNMSVKWLLTIDSATCWIRYCVMSLLYGMGIALHSGYFFIIIMSSEVFWYRACFLIPKVKLVPPSFLRSSYVSPSIWFVLQYLLGDPVSAHSL